MKVAISIPDPLFEAAEREAKRRKLTRSRVYAEALQAFLRKQEDDRISESLNRVYATEDSRIPEEIVRASFESSPESTW